MSTSKWQEKGLAQATGRLTEIGNLDETRGMRIARTLVVTGDLLITLGADSDQASAFERAMKTAMKNDDYQRRRGMRRAVRFLEKIPYSVADPAEERLKAAAPDLLRELQKIVDHVKEYEIQGVDIGDAEAAIKKATVDNPFLRVPKAIGEI